MIRSAVLTAICFLGFFSFGFAQDNNPFISALNNKEAVAKAAADQKTNFKSIVTDLIAGRYYQALIKNGILNQKEGELQVKSTIYGLIRLFDSTRSEQHYFEKLRWARNIQLGTGVTISDNNKINSVGTALKIAILNKREYKDSANLLTKNGLSAVEITEATSLLDTVSAIIERKVNDTSLSQAEIQQLTEKYQQVFDSFNASAFDFNLLNELLTAGQIQELNDKWKVLTDRYDAIQKKLSRAPILTFGHEGSYKENRWQKLNHALEFLVGFGNKEDSVRKYDFYAGAFYEIGQDTLNKVKSLNRQSFLSKIGVNTVVWKDKTDGSSIMEIFGGAEYQHINKGIYADEKKSALKLDMTLSIRLAKNLYLPFQVKYNASTGRFEGFLDLKFDVVNIFK